MAASNSKPGKGEAFKEKLKTWVGFYRKNPHRFAKDFLNVELKPFQAIILCEMFDNIKNVIITCRGLGKTFLTALFAVIRSILYPGTQIVLASKTRKQAALLIDKIEKILIPNSPLLKMEIQDIIRNQYDTSIVFKNASNITVVTANENARGYRGNILILDEFRQMPKEIYRDILKKFLNVNRQPPYLSKPGYEGYTEENIEIFLSSAWYSDSWCYDQLRTTAAQMITGKYPYFCCALPYQLAYKENLLTRARILSELTDPDYNEITWMMEMEADFFLGASDSTLYEYGDINPARQIKYAFYPPSLSSMVSDRRVRIPPKMNNEFRIISADIALMASSAHRSNDATSILVNQMLFDSSYSRAKFNIVYGENVEGKRIEEQALLIRKRFDEYEADALVIDARGVGMGVLDLIMADMYDESTGVVYGALSSVNEEIADRCHVRNAPRVIYPILATADFNSSIALGLRESFKDGKINLLQSEDDFDDFAADASNGIAGYAKLSLEDRTRFKLPYINTTLLINELVSLQYETKNGLVRVKERSGMRKDRYSSLAYSIAIAKQIEKQWREDNTKKSFSDLVFMFRAPQTN